MINLNIFKCTVMIREEISRESWNLLAIKLKT